MRPARSAHRADGPWYRSTSVPGAILVAPETDPSDLETEQIIQVDMSAGNVDATARLVLAAPAMLEALLQLEQWWEAIGSLIFNRSPKTIEHLQCTIADVSDGGGDTWYLLSDKGAGSSRPLWFT